MAFRGCYTLESIEIPDGVTSIGHDAFAACFGLNSITIPGCVTRIEKNAFFGCKATITYKGKTYSFLDNAYEDLYTE